MVDFFLDQYKDASITQIILEFVAFIFGILSVYFAKKENILVYPTGIISTIITVYLLYKAKYFGEMTVNFYYSIMSVYGWYMWSKKQNQPVLHISRTNNKEKIIGILLFFLTIFICILIYNFFDYQIEHINYIDIFTTGIFFTAMWYMALKKIENWSLWIIGNLIVIPLFAYRGLGILSIQYFIFTIMAVAAYIEWRKILQNKI